MLIFIHIVVFGDGVEGGGNIGVGGGDEVGKVLDGSDHFELFLVLGVFDPFRFHQ